MNNLKHSLVKGLLIQAFLFVSFGLIFAQNGAKADFRAASQATVIKIDGSAQSGWVKGDNDNTSTPTTQTNINESVSFSSTSEGIFVTILNGTNKIKLFALTGQLIFNGDLTQGRFLIQTRKGIYFLKINNKSYKVICK